MPIKVVYIISDVNKALAFEWISSYINKDEFQLSFIILNPSSSFLLEFLKANSFDVSSIRCSGKKDWPVAIWKTYRILRRQNPDVVHCHLIQANIIGLTAAKLAGIKKRIYTRHHSSLHHIYFPKGVWWDKLANRLSTNIIAISGVVQKILIDWEGVNPKKVTLIPHGFLLSSFSDINRNRLQAFRERHQINEGQFIIGVVSRFTEWKGVQYTISAFYSFHKEYPNSVLLLLNARGDYEQVIRQQLDGIPKKNYRLIEFENDIAAAYKCMDIFIHVPIDEHSEAFGQIYVEALAAGIPSIFTLSGVADDFIKNKYNAIVVPYKNSKAIFEGMVDLQTNKELRSSLKINGCKSVENEFELYKMINSLEQLYES